MSVRKTQDKQESGERRPSAAGLTEPAKGGARAQILAAATELAKEMGAAHISIEAIALRAGLSKGGLLYHFPKKAALIQALAEQHMADVEAMISDVEAEAGPKRANAVARAFVQHYRDTACQHRGKLNGILMALAENPQVLDPLRVFEKRIVEHIRKSAVDCDLSLMALLVVEGIRALDLFEANPLADEECRSVLDRVLTMLDGEAAGSGEGR